jgi:hypothetical protein
VVNTALPTSISTSRNALTLQASYVRIRRVDNFDFGFQKYIGKIRVYVHLLDGQFEYLLLDSVLLVEQANCARVQRTGKTDDCYSQITINAHGPTYLWLVARCPRLARQRGTGTSTRRTHAKQTCYTRPKRNECAHSKPISLRVRPVS